MLVNGTWDPEATLERDDDGAFVRQESGFRDRVEADPAADHPAESGRYHLYVSYACPWAHRTLIGRALLGIKEHVTVDVVDPIRHDDGWQFSPDKPGCSADSIMGADHLRELYVRADPGYSGRVTVPVLWDREAETIVNNESIEVLRQFDTAFVEAFDRPVTLYPSALADEIDATVETLYEPINNGVYRVGFAETQRAYDRAVEDLFDALERWDEHLGEHRYLVGDHLTEADVCLFTTLLRFDPVYHVHFKCSYRRIVDYPNLWDYLKELAQVPVIAETIEMDHIRQHYYRTHPSINPTGIVAVAPAASLDEPHDRDRLGGDPPVESLSR